MDPVTAIVWIVGIVVGAIILNSISGDIRIVKTTELDLKETELKYQQRQIDQLLSPPKEPKNAQD